MGQRHWSDGWSGADRYVWLGLSTLPGADTAHFVYLRSHGQTRLYGSSYDEDALRAYAERIRAWRDTGLDVYAYFNNHERAVAPRDALRLRELVG